MLTSKGSDEAFTLIEEANESPHLLVKKSKHRQRKQHLNRF